VFGSLGEMANSPTISMRVTAETIARLEALVAKLRVLKRPDVAKAAFLLGLAELEKRGLTAYEDTIKTAPVIPVTPPTVPVKTPKPKK
jgi:hypothetical protein